MLRYKLDQVYPTILRFILDNRGWKRAAPHEPYDLYWKSGRFPKGLIEDASPNQVFNHFPNSGRITRKAGTTHFLNQMRRFFPDAYDYSFPSFIFNHQKMNAIIENINPALINEMWIIKPSNGSRGRGIQIVRNLWNIVIPPNEPERFYTAQLYLCNPWLIRGYKFDIRIYALVTSFHPLTIYVYKQGLVRFATQPFCIESELMSGGLFGHLTNTSVNRYSPIFRSKLESPLTESPATVFESKITEAFGLGSKYRRTLKQFISHCHNEGLDFRPIWNRIKKMIVLTLLPVVPHVPKVGARCFELYGFDVILDDQHQPWLLEVNFSPSLSGHSVTDQTIKEGLIQDMFDILDICPTAQGAATEEKKQYTRDYYNFLSHNPEVIRNQTNDSGLLGGFERIFPVNEDTRTQASGLGAAVLTDENYKDIVMDHMPPIVESVQAKYGSRRAGVPIPV